MSVLRVHEILPYTRANGPGARAAMWLQGCTLGCAGCFNPATHARGGRELAVDEAVTELLAQRDAIEGITVSGGEPLQQPAALLALLRAVRHAAPGMSVVLFTGYAWEVARRRPHILREVDVVLAGPYDASRRVARGLVGSTNKTLHLLTDRYTLSDMAATPQAEVVILETGEVVLTGIDPLERRSA